MCVYIILYVYVCMYIYIYMHITERNLVAVRPLNLRVPSKCRVIMVLSLNTNYILFREIVRYYLNNFVVT